MATILGSRGWSLYTVQALKGTADLNTFFPDKESFRMSRISRYSPFLLIAIQIQSKKQFSETFLIDKKRNFQKT
jgi:hypothetical protein